MAWQDYVNEKYSKKKKQETAESSSPSAASGGNRTLAAAAQIRKEQQASGGTWQNYVNQKYGAQAAAQQTAQQNRVRQANAQVRQLYNRQQAQAQARQDALDELRARAGITGTKTITGGARVGGREETREPVKWNNGGAARDKYSAKANAVKLRAEAPDHQDTARVGGDEGIAQDRYSARANAVRARQEAYNRSHETIREARIRQLREQQPVAEATDKSLPGPAEKYSAARTAADTRREQAKLGTIEDKWAETQYNESLRPFRQLAGAGLKAAGNVLNMAAQTGGTAADLLGQLYDQAQGSARDLMARVGEGARGKAEEMAGAVERFMEANPDGLSEIRRPELQNAFSQAYLARMDYEGPRDEGELLDVGDRSAAMDERLDLILNQLSHADEVDLYYEDNGPAWALGTDKQQAKEKELKLLQEQMFNKKNQAELMKNAANIPANMEANDPLAMQAMEDAGGDYAKAVEEYKAAAIGNRLEIIGGQLVPVDELQGPRPDGSALGDNRDQEQALENLQIAWAQYKRDMQKRASAARDELTQAEYDFTGAQEELRQAWNADYEQEALSEYQKLKAEEDRTYEELLQGRREDYKTEYEKAESEAEQAPVYMMMYYATLDSQPDFEEISADGPYHKPTDEEKLAYATTEDGQVLRKADGSPDVQADFLLRKDHMSDVMSELQIRKANYLYKKEGPEAAEEYIKAIEPELNRIEMEGKRESAYQYGQEHPGWTYLASGLMNTVNEVMGGAYALNQIGDSIINHKQFEFDENHPMRAAAVMRDAMREGQSQKWFGDRDTPITKALGWANDVFNSGAIDSTLNGLSFGRAGALLMGTGVMADSIANTEGTPEQKIAMGIVDGALETLTEYLGIDRMFRMFQGAGKATWKNLLGEILPEGAEEVISFVGDTLAEWLIKGDESEIRKTYDKYVNDGLDEGPAMGMTFLETAKQGGLEFLGGALGSLFTAGGSVAMGKAFNQISETVEKNDINREARKYGKAASVFQNNWDGKMFPEVYKKAFDALYDAGANGISLETVQEVAPEIVGQMSEATQETIYTAGQNMAAQEAQETAQTTPATAETAEQGQTVEMTAEQEQTQAAEPEVVRTVDGIQQTEAQVEAEERYQEMTPEERKATQYIEGNVTPGVVRMFDTSKRLTAEQRTTLRNMDIVGKRFGFEIDMVDTLENGRANGVYTPGERRMIVALDASNNAYMQVAGHEMVHYIKASNQDAYNVLAQVVESYLREAKGFDMDAAIQQRIAQYDKFGWKLGATPEEAREGAREEVIAEAVPTIFTNEDYIRQIVQQDRTLGQKIKDALENCIRVFRELVEKMTLRNYEDAVNYAMENKRGEIWALIENTEALQKIANQFETAMSAANEANEAKRTQARETAELEQAASVNGEQRYLIKTDEKGRRYVKADRQVIHGDNPDKWGGQVINYINSTIRQGKDVVLTGEDGDLLTITKNTAGKAAFRNSIQEKGGIHRKMNDDEYAAKLRAEAHIDELAQVSSSTKEHNNDTKNHPFAKDGWTFRKALFEDFDGTRYRLKISVGENGEIKTIYNVGQMKRTGSSNIKSQKAEQTDAVLDVAPVSRNVAVSKDGTALANNVPQAGRIVNKEKAAYQDGHVTSTPFANLKELLENSNEGKNSLKNQNRFSMKTPVERKGDLVAVHNVRADNLLKDINMGGIPMPSVAIVQAEKGHSEFGDISLVFYADNINPEYDEDNRVYGDDVWTPTFPETEAVVNEEGGVELAKRFEKTGEKLKERGYKFPFGVYNEDYVLTKLENGVNSSPWNMKSAAYDLETRAPSILTYIVETDKYDKLNEVIKNAEDSGLRIGDAISLLRYDEAFWSEYDKWWDNEVKNLVKTVFQETGEDATAENAVEIMKQKPEVGTLLGGFRGFVNAASKKYASLEEVKADSERLKGNDAKAFRRAEQKYEDLKISIASRWAEREMKANNDTDYDYWYNDARHAFEQAMQRMYSTNMSEWAFMTEFGDMDIPITEEEIGQFIDLIQEAGELPADYFEAKPRRVVGFDEIAAAIIPEDDEGRIRNNFAAHKMEQLGVQVIRYPAGDEDARLAALNSIKQPGVRFSLKNTGDNDVDTASVLEGMNGRPRITITGINDALQNTTVDEATAANQTMREADSNMEAAQTMARAAMQRMAKVGWRQARNYADLVLNLTASTYDKADMRENMAALMEEIATNGPSQATLDESAKLARAVLDKSKEMDTSFRDQYADLRKRLRETPVRLTDTQKQEAANIAGSYGKYMQSMFGTLRLSDKADMSLDGWWGELSQQYPDLFPPETSEGDMMQVLADLKAKFMPRYDNPYGETIEAASTDLGLQMHAKILDILGDTRTRDDVRRAIEQLRTQFRAEYDAELLRVKRDQREAFDNIASALRQANKTGNRDAAAKAMTRYRSQLKGVGATQAEAMARLTYRQEYEDHEARAHAFEQVRKISENLRRMLAKPDKKKHIPTELQEPILRMLDSIDFTRNGRETEGTRAWKESLQAIANVLARQLDKQQRLDQSENVSQWMTLMQPQIDQLNENIAKVKGAGKSVYAMSMQEMRALSDAMGMVQHIINAINQAWTNERYADMDALGEQTIRDLQDKADNKAQQSNALMNWLDSVMNVQNLDAGSLFERLGGQNSAAYSVFRELAKGQSDAYAKIREANEKVPELLGITKENERQRRRTIQGWMKEENTFEIPVIKDGEAKLEKATMTGTQLMELYALSRRAQGKMHLLAGGFTLTNKKGQQGTTTYKVTEEQLNSMLDQLTDDQKTTTQRLQDYLSNTVSGWGNEVTQRMYLMRLFGEDNYWPIVTDSDYRRTREKDGTVLFNALTNAGFTKQLQDMAKNPLVINDALTTFAGHVSDMASFAGLAMPVDDFLRWYNYADKDENGHMAYNKTVKKEIRRTTGVKGIQYVQHLLDDLNGMGKQAPTTDWMKLVGNYKRAAIMAKLRVVIQQPTAVLRASAMINPKYFSGMLKGVGKHTVKEMQDHSPLAWWKSNGNYEIGTGASMKSIVLGMQDNVKDEIMEKMGAAAGWADDKGWVIIWQAVKRETAAEHPELEVGSKEYWSHVRERFEDVCMKTQVVDTVLTRSEMMRSKDALMKMATAFMSEPTKNVNLIRNAIEELTDAIRRKDSAAIKRASARLTRSGAAITAATALNAVVKAAFDTIKYRDPDKDKDEWGENISFWNQWLERMTESFFDDMNPLTNIPFIKDAYDMLESVLKGEQATTAERIDLSVLAKLLNALSRAYDYTHGNDKGYTAYGMYKPVVKALGDVFGLPVSGLIDDAEFAINLMKPGALKTKKDTATAAGGYEALYKAIASGDTKKAEQLKLEMKKGQGGRDPKSSKEISEGVAKQLALNDDRIRECWEMRQAGKSGIARIKNAVIADGFTDEEVTKAINSYDTTIKSEVKEYYLKAVEKGDEEKAKEYVDMLHKVGVEDKEIDSWTKPKDTEEELQQKADYEKKNLYTAIRSKDSTTADIMDIRDNILKYSTAEDPEKAMASALSKEFRQEYIELVDKGKTGEAKKLRDRLLKAGAKETTIDAWVPDDRRDKMYDAIDGGSEAQIKAAVKAYLSVSTAEDPEKSLRSSLGSKYRDDYIELVRAGKTTQAQKLRTALIAAGMKKDTIDKWNEDARKKE